MLRRHFNLLFISVAFLGSASGCARNPPPTTQATQTVAIADVVMTERQRKASEILREAASAADSASSYTHKSLVARVIDGEIDAGNFSAAVLTASQIKEDYPRQMEVEKIAEYLAASGRFEQAMQLLHANGLRERYRFDNVLSRSAAAHARAGDPAEAIRTAGKIEHLYWRSMTLAMIVQFSAAGTFNAPFRKRLGTAIRD